AVSHCGRQTNAIGATRRRRNKRSARYRPFLCQCKQSSHPILAGRSEVSDTTIKAAAGVVPAPRTAFGTWGDRCFHGITAVSALLVLALIIGIGVSLLIGAWPALSRFGFGFFTSTQWNPVTHEYGAL